MGYDSDGDGSDTDPGNNENQAVIDLVETLGEIETFDLAGAGEPPDHILVLPRGKRIEDLKPYLDKRRTAPERRTGTAKLTTLESFTQHVLRFLDEHSVIFANDTPSAPALTAVLDYHEKGSDGAPRFGTHRSVYAFPLSDEWKAWTGLPKEIEQGALAAFLESHIGDVLDPIEVLDGTPVADFATRLGIALAGPSTLMTLSRGLSVRVDTKVASAVNLGSGEGKLLFEETHQASDHAGPLTVPGGFALAIPVFKGGDVFKIPARLTYRVSRSHGSITWGIALHRTDKAFQTAFDESIAVVEKKTGLPVLRGTPEG